MSSNSLPQKYRAYHILKPGNGYDTDNLKIVDITSTPDLQAEDILVKIHAVSLNHRDLNMARGDYGGGMLPDNLQPASDAAGEIIAVGQRVHNWSIGQRVCANFTLDHIDGDPTPEMFGTHLGGPGCAGVLAEYRVVPAHSLVAIPDYMTYEEASTLPCAGVTAYNALYGPKALTTGDFVLILGTGGVSIFGIQIAIAAGATVIVTSSSDEKLEVVKKLGAQHVINYNQHKNWDEEVLKITNGRGVDHVVEVGGMGTLPQSLKSLKLGGSVAVVGYVAGYPPPGDSLVHLIIFRAPIIRGILIGSVAQFKDLIRLLATHQIKPVVDKVFGFAEGVEAFKYLASQKHVGNVVVRVSS